MSRTLETQEVYFQRSERILAAFTRESGLDWREDPDRLFDWLRAYAKALAPSSWYLYRTALAHYFSELVSPQLGEQVRAIAAADRRQARALPKRTSSLKSRTLSDEDLERLLGRLDRHREVDRHLAVWLVAGRLCGLRPGEWRQAVLTEDTLVVRNAKATNGRSFARTRTLQLSGLDPAERQSVARMVELSTALDDAGWARRYAACRKRLATLARRLWPRRKYYPSLYSARHQFRSDQASRGASALVQAALMGHGSLKSAEKHYGRRKHGRGGSGVAPSEEDLQQVKKRQSERQGLKAGEREG